MYGFFSSFPNMKTDIYNIVDNKNDSIKFLLRSITFSLILFLILSFSTPVVLDVTRRLIPIENIMPDTVYNEDKTALSTCIKGNR